MDINYQLPQIQRFPGWSEYTRQASLQALAPPPVLSNSAMKAVNQQKLNLFKLYLTLQNRNLLLGLAVSSLTGQLSNQVSEGIFGTDTELGQAMGNLFSTGINTAGDQVVNNIFKGESLMNGMSQNVGSSLAGAGAGIAANYIGKGISSLGGNSKLSRGLGAGFATGAGTLGGGALSNIINGERAFGDIADSFKAIKTFNQAKKAADFAKGSPEALEALKASKLGTLNLAGLGASIVGTGLQAAFGPSKEYGGTYGNITRGLDTAYDLVQGAAGFIPGVGTAVSGFMALNKGLSNIFGSTSGMTRQDAILGSAFMPASVKWLNMAGAKTTDKFRNQSWQNQERTNTFMQNGFGDLEEKFDKARRESGKTYGTFSRHAYNKAQSNLNFANDAFNKILDMADDEEIRRIRSEYMTSINNQRYAQDITGGFRPLYRGKEGMKIFNNATNHNMGMRLLSGAALIDNKQMILSAQGGTKVIRPKVKSHGRTNLTKPSYMTEEEWNEYLENRKQFEEYKKSIGVETNNENPYTEEELKQQAEWNAHLLEVRKWQAEEQARKLKLREEAAVKFNLQANLVLTAMNLQANETPFTGLEYQQATENLRQEKVEKFHEKAGELEKGFNAALMADLAVSAAPLLLRGFRWAFNKAGNLVKVPANRFTVDGNISSIENTQKFIPNFSKMTRDEKLLWLKTLQELAYKVDLARTLDALHMTKTRVKLGGAKRLDDAFSNDMYSSPEESIFSENLKLGHTTDELEKMAMEKNLLENVKKKPIKGTAELISNKMNDAGISDRLTIEDGAVAYKNKLYTDVPSDAGFDLKGFRKGLKGAAHEFVHFLYQPISKPRGMNFPKSYIGDYLSGEGPVFETTGATEVSARGTQIKNYFGLKEGELITPEMWNYAARHYMKDVGDNNMSTMFKFANTTSLEFPYVLKWINKHAPAVIPSIIGGSTAATLYNKSK